MTAGAGNMERIPEFIGNHPFLVSLFVAILMLLLWNVFGGAISGIAQLAPADATFLINRENGLLIDVRPEAEFRTGHILNAVNIPEAALDSRREWLEKHKAKPIITCCQNGSASARVARNLRAGGFEKVNCLKGGLAAWQSAGLPLTREAEPEKAGA